MAISNRLAESLKAAGVDVDVQVCSVAEVSDQLTKLTEQLQDDVKKTIDQLSYKSFGNFFVIAAALLAETLGGAAIALVDHYVGEAIFSNFLGAVSSAIAMLFVSIPGISIIIKYYAAVSIRRDAARRYELGKILLNEIRTIISWVDVLSNTGNAYTAEYYNDLRNAFTYVGKARRTINIEAAKHINRANYVSGGKLDSAVDDIDTSIGYLTPGYKETLKLLKEIHKEYKLETKIPESTVNARSLKGFVNIKDWIKYVEFLNKELKQKFSGEGGQQK